MSGGPPEIRRSELTRDEGVCDQAVSGLRGAFSSIEHSLGHFTEDNADEWHTAAHECRLPLSAWQHAIEQKGFVQDEAQEHAVWALQKCHEALHEGRKSISGVYLWGPVGRGKTWLMDQFYQHLRVPARRQHFHHFMGWVHQRSFQLTGTADPLKALARELAEEVRVLCFDELFVNDIGDAIILGRLFQVMFEQGVVVVCTSNLPPDQLYADGFNRDRFLPAIAAIKQHMQVIAVDGGEDHRLHPGQGLQRYWVIPPDNRVPLAMCSRR